jgi:hypothetical protein
MRLPLLAAAYSVVPVHQTNITHMYIMLQSYERTWYCSGLRNVADETIYISELKQITYRLLKV